MRAFHLWVGLSFLVLSACGGGATSSGAANETIRPAGIGWYCHGAEHAAFCARSEVECDALRVDTALDPGAHPCDAHPIAYCFTYNHPTIGEHYRCFDTAEHCSSRLGQCTSEETCSTCVSWE